MGKIKVFEKCENSKEKMNLLQDIGVPSSINEKTVGKVSKFIPNNVLLRNGRWISHRHKRKNLQAVRNEDFAINTSR